MCPSAPSLRLVRPTGQSTRLHRSALLTLHGSSARCPHLGPPIRLHRSVLPTRLRQSVPPIRLRRSVRPTPHSLRQGQRQALRARTGRPPARRIRRTPTRRVPQIPVRLPALNVHPLRLGPLSIRPVLPPREASTHPLPKTAWIAVCIVQTVSPPIRREQPGLRVTPRRHPATSPPQAPEQARPSVPHTIFPRSRWRQAPPPTGLYLLPMPMPFCTMSTQAAPTSAA